MASLSRVQCAMGQGAQDSSFEINVVILTTTSKMLYHLTVQHCSAVTLLHQFSQTRIIPSYGFQYVSRSLSESGRLHDVFVALNAYRKTALEDLEIQPLCLSTTDFESKLVRSELLASVQEMRMYRT